ncbi:MAG TPA: hypothetical protein VE863_12745 [Pyrinomonadaceae bacterium]|jgi:hypothetical protein|nr:hypothetical protein [Pyrinomonadaceae bacterium]
MKRLVAMTTLIFASCFSTLAQQPNEIRVGLSDAATAMDGKAAPALEARLLTQVLNGSDESPVTNVKIAIKNITPNFYTYVSGWATFYDANATRCGEGLFKLDALAPQESAEVDTPGLRLRCSPTQWRIVATDLMTRTADMAKPAEAVVATQPERAVERPAPINFVISIDGEEHPIQLNNPIVLKLANKNRKIIVRQAP